jgi:hypothetical protein
LPEPLRKVLDRDHSKGLVQRRFEPAPQRLRDGKKELALLYREDDEPTFNRLDVEIAS